jgi:hypothetical protein
MEDALIDLPSRDKTGTIVGDWHITGCWTKLCLKYGVIGPWSQPNWSVAFDRYSLSRGPRNGPLSLADFAITLLMNSRISSKDILALTNYFAQDHIRQQTDSLTATLARCGELADLCPADITQLGEFLDALIYQVSGIGKAKAYKGLAAWAPSHVFMLDVAVCKALTGREEKPSHFPSVKLIERFKSILMEHHGTLKNLGERLAVAAILPAPLPSVRVLDSLIWFDWWACQNYVQDFGSWVQPDWDGGQHKLLRITT